MSEPILVVDDFEGDARLLAWLLKRAGIQNPTTILENGLRAISYLKGEGVYADRIRYPLPAVIFLDLRMPRMDGYEVLDWLQRQPQLKPILVIALSALTEPSDINRAYEMGARSFLAKPCTLEDLANLQKVFPGYWKVSAPANPSLSALEYSI
jgi:CheY-like chemotaxis protein